MEGKRLVDRYNAFLGGKLVGKIKDMEFTRKYPLVLLVKAGQRQGRRFECKEGSLVEKKSKFRLTDNKCLPFIS